MLGQAGGEVAEDALKLQAGRRREDSEQSDGRRRAAEVGAWYWIEDWRSRTEKAGGGAGSLGCGTARGEARRRLCDLKRRAEEGGQELGSHARADGEEAGQRRQAAALGV